ncbi:MAG: methionine--tRNA ligase [Candidatus Absconditabacteria bacterium]|nr:methionine--tRNA ligase [Candidatus Absconditabacteria bacterium]
MAKKFLVTTPIYYPNGYPHIGHANSSFIADVYARFKRLLGYEVKFSTGNDENSQKILQQAESEGTPVMEYLDHMAQKWEEVWQALSITYTDFIRTTAPHHKELVQNVLQKAYDKGDIYEGEYKGYYCVGCESFKKETDLIKNEKGELICPDHLKTPDILTEKNRFFKLQKYEQAIKDFYKNYPTFVEPGYRFNEVKSFVEGGLEDFSVSRETNTFGIPLPFDPSQVTYVWYDALFNYVTVSEQEGFWSEDVEKVHILGKDIVRFHAIFWPAMLASAEMALPNHEYVTGYFTVDGQKMSKSLGNVVDPVEMVQKYDRDAVVFMLMYDVPIGSDGDFSEERLGNVYDSMVIGGWGNLVNRVVSLCSKYGISEGKCMDNNFFDGFDILKIEEKYLKSGNIQGYLQDRYRLVQSANEFITKAEPWKKYKDEATKEEAISDLKFLLYIVKNLALLSAPFLVNGFAKIQTMFENELLSKIDSSKNIFNDDFQKAFDMKEFTVDLKPEIIYKRVDAI